MISAYGFSKMYVCLLVTLFSFSFSFFWYHLIFRMTNSLKMKYSSLVRFILICSLIGSLFISSGFLYISSHNYPGGYAFDRLHRIESRNNSLSVHIGVEAAMSGVSRFGELNDNWRFPLFFSLSILGFFLISSYSKEEGLGIDQYSKFDYLLANETLSTILPNFHVVEAIKGFQRIEITKRFPFVNVVNSPQIFILKRNEYIDL